MERPSRQQLRNFIKEAEKAIGRERGSHKTASAQQRIDACQQLLSAMPKSDQHARTSSAQLRSQADELRRKIAALDQEAKAQKNSSVRSALKATASDYKKTLNAIEEEQAYRSLAARASIR